jgi:quercetin dioxygenase-like cupin family protein
MLSKLFAVIFSVTIFAKVTAQESTAFPKGEISATDNHTGTIWLNELSKPDSIFNNSIALATYGAGAKLDWHIHPAGQVLLITEGTGYYQEKDQPVKVVYAGDIIKCMPGVPHWHGAVPQSSFAYMAVTPAQKGKTIWQKRVTDEEYNQIGYSAAGKNTEQEITDLSKKKWDWMSDKNVDSLNLLFAEKSMFVHMGGSWGKAQELATIKSGGIWYKKAEVYSVTVNTFGNTAILLNDIDLKAVVGGNEVVHSFMVTEVYIKEDGKWKMGSLTFSQLLRPVKMK